MPVAKNDLKLRVNQQFIVPSLYNQMIQLVFITDTFRPRIKCTTLCLCEVSRFLSKFLTDHAAAARKRQLDWGRETIFVSLPGRPSLSPRVSPSRALVLSCAHYFQAPATQAMLMVFGVQNNEMAAMLVKQKKNSVEIELFSQVKISLFFQELCIPADHVSKKQSLSLRIQTPCACVLLTFMNMEFLKLYFMWHRRLRLLALINSGRANKQIVQTTVAFL